MKKLAVLSMTAVLAAGCFVGCGSKDSSGGSKYAGKYEASKVVLGDQEFTTDFNGGSIATYMQIELTSDGKVIGWNAEKQEEEKETGKWSADGNEIKLTFESENASDSSESEGGNFTIKVDGDDYIMDEGDSGKIYLKKVSEYTTVAATEASED